MKKFVILALLALPMAGCFEPLYFKKGAAVDAVIQKETSAEGENSPCIIHIWVHESWGNQSSDLALRAKLLTDECKDK